MSGRIVIVPNRPDIAPDRTSRPIRISGSMRLYPKPHAVPDMGRREPMSGFFMRSLISQGIKNAARMGDDMSIRD